MNTAATKNFKSLLRKIAKHPAPTLPEIHDPVEELVFSFLMWESTSEKAVAAHQRIVQHIVDFNDLRVSMPHEIVEFIGERYPLAQERAQRLRATLRDIYLREHCVSLERVSTLGKREIKKYMESLEGIVPYVSTRVMLRQFDTHGIPVDEQLMGHLVEEKIAEADTELATLSTWLSRQVKAGEGIQVHDLLQGWLDTATPRPVRKTKSKTTRAAAPKKTAKKTAKPAAKSAAKPTTKPTTKKKSTTTKKKTAPRAASKAATKSASKSTTKKKTRSKKTASRS